MLYCLEFLIYLTFWSSVEQKTSGSYIYIRHDVDLVHLDLHIEIGKHLTVTFSHKHEEIKGLG